MRLEDLVRNLWDRAWDMLDAGGMPVDDMALDVIGRDQPVTVRYYDQPKPLADPDGVIHPALRGGNANWRSASVAWDEHRAMIWGEAEVDGQTYYIAERLHVFCPGCFTDSSAFLSSS